MIKVKHKDNGQEFEVSDEHWSQVLSRSSKYELVVSKPPVKKAAPKKKVGRPSKVKES